MIASQWLFACGFTQAHHRDPNSHEPKNENAAGGGKPPAARITLRDSEGLSGTAALQSPSPVSSLGGARNESYA
jgi:hypothetical protein